MKRYFRENKIYPYCYIKIIACIILYSLFLGAGIFFICYGVAEKDIFRTVLGVVFVIIPAIMCILFYFWLRSLFIIEFKEDYILYNYIEMHGKILHKLVDEISLIDLSILEITKDRELEFIYKNGYSKSINLKDFGKKQRIAIRLEILKRACCINGYAVKEICF